MTSAVTNQVDYGDVRERETRNCINGDTFKPGRVTRPMTAGDDAADLLYQLRLTAARIREHLNEAAAPPWGTYHNMGIRSLISSWSVFFAQVVLGASAALIVYLVFGSGLLAIRGLPEPSQAVLIVFSFIAGFSEPFLTDIVGKISRLVV